MQEAGLRQLSDDQAGVYDLDLIQQRWWEEIAVDLEHDLPSRLSVLEMGGGNGLFADRVLQRFPGATATVLDSSPVLLARNRQHPRKHIVAGRIESLPSDVATRRYDLVTFHWVLHHLVAGRYRASRQAQRDALIRGAALLASGGRISVFENAYDGVIADGLPSRAIHTLSSSRVIAPVMRVAGGDPAGVGVCFLSERAWLATFDEAGLRVVSRRRYRNSLGYPRRWYGWLLPARMAVCHYWLQPVQMPPGC